MPQSPKRFREPKRRDERAYESRRNGNHGMYNLQIWRRPGGVRDQVLARDPLCVDCLKHGKYVPSTEADHDEPHNGDYEKFVDIEKIHGRCKPCHSRKTVLCDGGLGREKMSENRPAADRGA